VTTSVSDGFRAISRGEPGGRRIAASFVAVAFLFVCVKSVGNFASYNLRAKSAEARTVLGGMKTQQASFEEKMGFYVSAGPMPVAPVPFGRSPWVPHEPCPADCAATNPGACQKFSCIDYRPSSDVYYQYACTATASGGIHDFTCAATADLDRDGELSVFVYGTANRPGAKRIVASIPTNAPLGDCATERPVAGEIVNCTPDNF